MKYIIKYYQNINGVWEFTVKTTEDFELFINYLKSIERYRFYKLYSVSTDWEGTKNDHLA